MMQRRYDAYRTRWCGRSSAIISRGSTGRSCWSMCWPRSTPAGGAARSGGRAGRGARRFRVGRNAWLSALFSPRADRILFAATKADHFHHRARPAGGHPQASRRAPSRAPARRRRGRRDRARRGPGDARGALRGEGGDLPSIVGVAAPGERSNGQHFDGETEMAFFPGDLPGRRLPRAAISGRSASGRRCWKKPTTAFRRCPTFASTARCNS